ncbi:hypothetical protein U8V72_22455 [Priestia filamentosa]|uniref:hypothetical protein n=1 Tax=Priestia filamentosa TaxID=1402861 RepID=UPI00397C2049
MTESIQTMLKKSIENQVRNFDIEELKKMEDKYDTVTLYHGTNTYYLNKILEQGILPQNLTGNNNWRKEEALANENIVYLTNKWHYFYAYNSIEMLLEKKYGEDWSSKEEGQWWINKNVFPIYLTIKIPKVYLTLDEDIVYSKYVKDKIKQAVKKKSEFNLNLTWNDCLSHHGTVGVRGSIPKEFIEDIHVLGDAHLYLELMNKKGKYQRDFRKWMDGKGKGNLTNLDYLIGREGSYKYNGVVPLKAIPKGYKISQFYYNEKLGEMAAIGNTPEDYVKQKMQLEKI